MYERTASDTLQELLLLVDVDVSIETIFEWTTLQRAMAEEWAAMVHLSASDNAFIRIPPRPAFLPK